MTLLQLRYFVCVCRCGSMTRAAQGLHISQPSLSEAIRNLECEFGLSLLDRQHHGTAATPAGLVFCREAQKLLDAEDALLLRMKRLAQSAEPLRVGVPPMLETLVFPALLSAYCRRCPQQTLNAVENGTQKNLELLRRGLLDAAVISSEEAFSSDPFKAQALTPLQISLFLSDAAPLARGTSVRFADCAALPLVLLSSDTFLSQFLESRCEQTGQVLRILTRTNQLTAIRHMVNSGTAAAILYRDALPPAEHIRSAICRR